MVSYNNAAVLRYIGTTGGFIDTFVASGSGGLGTSFSLVFGPDGNLYVPGGSFPRTGVFRYNGSTGAFISKFAVTGDSSPLDLAFGPDGNLYVLTGGNVRGVSRFNGRTGAFIDNFVPSGSGGLVNPYGFAFSPPRLEIRCAQVELCWESESNKVHQVQYRSSLTTNQWVNFGSPIEGDGTRKCLTDAVPEGQPQRFYNIVTRP